MIDLLQPLLDINPLWAVAALALQFCNLVLRSVTWRNVLAGAYPDEHLPAKKVGLAYAVGCALNGYLPARGGEAVKVALVRAQLPETNAVTVASSCSVVLVFDTLVGFTLLMIAYFTGAISAPPVPGFVETIAGAPLLAAGTVLAIVAAVWFIGRHAGPRIRRAWGNIKQGVAVLRKPGQYARTVLSLQALAWCSRIGVAFCLLHAFGINASLAMAALVIVVGGMSTAVPVPGGAGTQQALAVFVLAGIASASHALSFSVGMQVGVTLVNSTIGIIAAMIIFGHLHPVRAIKAALASTRKPSVCPKTGLLLPEPAFNQA